MSDFKLREVFNKDVVHYISDRVSKIYPEFLKIKFNESVLSELESLSYGDRANLITKCLEQFLPKDPKKSINILINVLGPEIEKDEINGYDGFYVQPLGSYIARNGIETFDLSMKALYEMTKRFTSESPIRKFIRNDWVRVKSYLNKWVIDPNPHVRRLVSEGTRPRLPLASPLKNFIVHPEELFPFLLKLKDDPVLFVRRSVANCINDISKDNSEKTIKLLSDFDKTDKKQMWIIKHSLRTLLKRTYPPALRLVGYSIPEEVKSSKLNIINNEIKIGNTLQFDFRFETKKKDQKLLIHYVIHYMKANGKIKPKVFIFKDKNFDKGIHLLKGKQSFKQMSTRKHYSGLHKLEIQINGKIYGSSEFHVD